MNIHDPLYAAAHPEPLTQVTLYSAPLIIPVTGPVILNGAIAVSGSRVVHVGTRRWVWDTLESELAAGARVEERHWHGVITPGLVNAHTHLQYTAASTIGSARSTTSTTGWTATCGEIRPEPARA